MGREDGPRDVRTEAAVVGCLLLAAPLLLVLAPLLALWLAWSEWRTGALWRRFARAHGAVKRGILVHSDSPNWQPYIETHWLPLVRDRLVILNWSERAHWRDRHPLEAALVRRHLGDREFNPAAIVLRAHGRDRPIRRWLAAVRARDARGVFAPWSSRVDVVRFFRPFRDHKHGRPHSLRAAEATLWRLLGMEHPGAEG